jgi:hypothetical protein
MQDSYSVANGLTSLTAGKFTTASQPVFDAKKLSCK